MSNGIPDESIQQFLHSGLLDHGTFSTSATIYDFCLSPHIVLYSRWQLSHYLTPVRQTVGSPSPVVGDLSTSYSGSPDITLLRGYPKSSNLQSLSQEYQKYGLPATFFFVHWNLPGTFRCLSLPTASWAPLKIRLISLGTWGSDFCPLSHHSPSQQQEQMDEITRKYNLNLLKTDHYGVEQYRKINIHRHFFSIEQEALFSIVPGEAGWRAILMTDCGLQDSQSPWRKIRENRLGRSLARILPLCRNGRFALDNLQLPGPYRGAAEISELQTLDPFSSRIKYDNWHMSKKDKTLAVEDPFVLVVDLMNTFVLCWIRLFCFLRCFHETLATAEDKVAWLQNDRSVLDRARYHIREMVAFVNSRETLAWPRASTQDGKAHVNMLVTQLQRDLSILLLEADSLSGDTSEMLATEMNIMSIRESKIAVSQGDRVRWITLLAYFFLPASLVVSCFGMNVDTFDDPKPRMTTFLAVALPFTVLFGILPQLYDAFISTVRRVKTWIS